MASRLKFLILSSVAIAFLSLIYGCKSQLPLLANHHTYIAAGSLGGFAGSYRECRILPDGSAFKKNKFNEEFRMQEQLDEIRFIQIESIVHEFKRSGIKLNRGGNMSYFIKWIKDGQDNFEAVWSDNGSRNKKLYELNRLIINSCKDEQITR